MENIKLIIFDLDGTLIDAYPAITRSFNYAMRKLKASPQKPSVIRRQVGWGDINLLKPFIKRKDLERGVFLYRQHHQSSLIKYSRLYPKAKLLLAYLKAKGYKLAVASNRPTKFSRILIRHLKIKEYFNFVLCADRLKYIKPHPQILNKIIKRFSLKPHQALYIGDMAIDACAGRRAGVRTIIVSTGSSTKQEIKKERPYLLINRISRLFGLL